MDRAFWDREQRANFTRKKPLDNLNYITIPDNILHMAPASMTAEIQNCLKDLGDLSSGKIVNLTGFTNTDLKLEYIKQLRFSLHKYGYASAKTCGAAP